MKNLFKAVSLSLVLASPLTFSQIAMAQELIQVSEPAPAGLVAQSNDDRAWNAYASSGYSYSDAVVLSKFWGQTVDQSKIRIGEKMLGDWGDKLTLELFVTDARTKALASVEDLTLFFQSGYSYSDAEAMAAFWGDKTPYESKLRIERNLIMGKQSIVDEVHKLIRSRQKQGF